MKSHTKSTPKPNIAFLHIPKTAGQSIHQWISNNYTNEQICPARTNEQLFQLPPVELRKYNFFSGHLDWNILKSIKTFDYVFTVLRQPDERIISFYFYLKKEAQRRKLESADKTLSPGLEMALLPINQYFENDDQNKRLFIDNHYNNFYSYYFASGSYNGFQRYGKNKRLSDAKILSLAIEMISSDYEQIFNMQTINELPKVLASKFEFKGDNLRYINKNEAYRPSRRGEDIADLALKAKWNWNSKIEELTRIDNILYDHLFNSRASD